jgi:thiol:disulfide interchange protein DsbD
MSRSRSRTALAAASALAAILLVASAAPSRAQTFSSSRVLKARGVTSVDRFHPGTSFQIAVVVEVEKGWHINAHEPSFDYLIPTLVKMDAATGFTFRDPVYPGHLEKAFTFTKGELLRVYEGQVLIGLDVAAGAGLQPGPATLQGLFSAQACNDTSCLAPGKVPLEIPVRVAAPGEAVHLTHQEIFSKIQFVSAGGASPAGGAGLGNEIASALTEGGLFFALGVIFLGGLALNLTPCVYPLIPITVSYFGGQASGRVARSLGLSTIYVLGMAITYSTLGVLAATTGGLLGSALQSPWVLAFVAAIMVALALSMFGLYEFALPGFITNRLQSRQGLAGALLMGLTVGLVAAPCIGPFVLGLLAYVGQLGDPAMGFLFFFVLSLGLGLPFLILGTFSGTVAALPQAGGWMVWVRNVFGCLLLGMALYFLQPVLPDTAERVGMATIFVASGIFLGFLERSDVKTTAFRAARYATAVIAVAGAAWILAPGGSAGESIAWRDYDPALLEEAAREGRPVLIDFTAEWCIACKELEHYTFSDPSVSAEAGRFLTMRADMTSFSTPPIEAIRERFGILGLPWVVLIDGRGRERSTLRVTGYVPADEFLSRMREVR